MSVHIRSDVRSKELALWLENTERGVTLMGQDSKGAEWSIVTITQNGTMFRHRGIFSQDIVSDETGHIKTEDEESAT